MPELPEVETIIRGLRRGVDGAPAIIGQEITGISLFWPKTLATHDPETASRLLKGQKVLAISRRAKYILLELNQTFLMVHLRMSGDLRMAPYLRAEQLLSHDRFYLHFASGWGLAFNDARKFGRVWISPDPASILPKLGPDPLDPSLDAAAFHQMLSSRGRQLKPLLMDQSFLAGVGNIYSTEALYEARLHPLQNSRYISLKEAKKLLQALRDVLEWGIAHNGTSIDWVYKGGDFQKYLKAYQHTGLPCERCGTPIKDLVSAQRRAHYCPRCQKLHE